MANVKETSSIQYRVLSIQRLAASGFLPVEERRK
jgi:hypothetical protein